MSKRYRVAAALLLVTAVLILLVAAGISEMELQKGTKFTVPLDDTIQSSSRRPDSYQGLLVLMRFLFAAALVGLPFFMLYSLFTPEGRRRLLALLFILGAMFLIISSRQAEEEPPPPPTDVAELMSTLEVEREERARLQNELTQVAEEPPNWILYAVVTGAALVVAAIVVALIWYFRSRAIDNELAQLGLEMRDAIGRIEQGGDLGSAVLNAYRDMARVVRQTQGVERPEAVTPHEYISVLERRGLPRQAVDEITSLFEKVRYGGKLASQEDEQRALSSLRAIAAACEERPRAA